MNVLGWYLEEAPGGAVHIVLVQPAEDPSENVEHVATTSAELWAAFMAIAEDPELPETQVVHERAAGDDLASTARDALESFVTEAGGPVLGRLCGGVLRNPDAALGFLRKISRKDRR